MRVAHFKIPSTLSRDESVVAATFIRASCWHTAYGGQRQWRRQRQRPINNYAVSSSDAEPFKLRFIHVAVRGRVVSQPSTQPVSESAGSQRSGSPVTDQATSQQGSLPDCLSPAFRRMLMCVCVMGGRQRLKPLLYDHFRPWKSRAKQLIMIQQSSKIPLH